MIGFEEKPKRPKHIPGDPTQALVSMGNYIFETEALYRELKRDAAEENSSHDFGKDIIPSLFPRAPSMSMTTAPTSFRARNPTSTGATWGRWTPTGRRTWT